MEYQALKRGIDCFIAILATVFLSPLLLFLAAAIKLESKGPVFFKQKRVGLHKSFFMIYKFRTMRTDTPKDVPTHLLEDPEQYITKVGHFLRKTSLDELPQLFNIIKGDMAIVGPRPALWNQDDLVAERDKYGANDVLPGLTGWAQINGRDELEIPVKAKLDGEYVKRMGLFFDLYCICGTVFSVLRSDGVVEGGTGTLSGEKQGKKTDQTKRTVVLIGNHHLTIYNFRKELIIRLLLENYRVVVLLPYTEEAEKIRALGCEIVDVPVDRRGMNPFKDLKLLFTYWKLLRQINPDMVLTYTIKPNIYGGFVCRKERIPYMATVTGLGSAMEGKGPVQYLTSFLYRHSMKKAECIFFQNERNRQVFEERGIRGRFTRLVAGSGVDLEHFTYQEMPTGEVTRFLFISRIMREKGIEEYLKTAKQIRQKYPTTEFWILGFCEDAYEGVLQELQEQGVIRYFGMQEDVIPFLASSQCLVHPSYAEGLSNVCLEAAATGRSIIASDIPGCRECIEDGITGFLVKPKNAEDLAEKIEKFLALEYNERKHMGELGRKKMEREFSREKVVDAYLEEIQNRLREKK